MLKCYRGSNRQAETQAQEVPSEVCYLGYVVSNEGISEAVKSYATPKQLRSFLGLASYYRRFIPSFSRVAAPLFALTRKDVLFQWDERCRKSFNRLKGLLI